MHWTHRIGKLVLILRIGHRIHTLRCVRPVGMSPELIIAGKKRCGNLLGWHVSQFFWVADRVVHFETCQDLVKVVHRRGEMAWSRLPTFHSTTARTQPEPVSRMASGEGALCHVPGTCRSTTSSPRTFEVHWFATQRRCVAILADHIFGALDL